MKPYSILIHGSGPCGEGTEQCADIALTGLLQQLQTAGHKFESVSMVIDGSAVPIIGALKEHPGLDAAADPGAVSLASISKQIATLDGKFSRFVAYEKKEDAEEFLSAEAKAQATAEKEAARAAAAEAKARAAAEKEAARAAAAEAKARAAAEKEAARLAQEQAEKEAARLAQEQAEKAAADGQNQDTTGNGSSQNNESKDGTNQG